MNATVTTLPTAIVCQCGHVRQMHAQSDGVCRTRGCDCTHETLPDGLLTTSQMLAATGITYRQLDYWSRTWLRPSTSRGSGHHRTFTTEEADLVRAVDALLDAGFTLTAAVEAARELVDRSLYVRPLDAELDLVITVRGDR